MGRLRSGCAELAERFGGRFTGRKTRRFRNEAYSFHWPKPIGPWLVGEGNSSVMRPVMARASLLGIGFVANESSSLVGRSTFRWRQQQRSCWG